MNLDRTSVVLSDQVDQTGRAPIERTVRAVEAQLRMGRKVILVARVGAEREERGALEAERLGPSGDPFVRAIVVNAGPVEAASVLAHNLSERGLRVAIADPRFSGPETRGHPLDAQPRSIDGRWYDRTLAKTDVLVVPGGVGRDAEKRSTSLGADGAELQAVFIASVLGVPVTVVESSGAALDWTALAGRKAQLLARDGRVPLQSSVALAAPGRGAVLQGPLRRLAEVDAITQTVA